MKALVLLGTLKRNESSNTEALSQFFLAKLHKRGITGEIVKLVDHRILPGTYSDMGEGDEWPKILEKILAADILVFATPIWWGNHSSEIQRVIERLDELHDEIMAGQKSRLAGKAAGILITGDSDGAQHVISQISNFCNFIGVAVPPYATLSVLWAGQAKGQKTARATLLEKYENEYAQTAETMIESLLQSLKVRNH